MLPDEPEEKDEDAEKDVGFGPSHGYDNGRGGPSGPGDAPAKPLPKTKPEGSISRSKPAGPVSDAFRPECRDSLLAEVDSLSTSKEEVEEVGGSDVD
jgi:hypothetical protein